MNGAGQTREIMLQLPWTSQSQPVLVQGPLQTLQGATSH